VYTCTLGFLIFPPQSFLDFGPIEKDFSIGFEVMLAKLKIAFMDVITRRLNCLADTVGKLVVCEVILILHVYLSFSAIHSVGRAEGRSFCHPWERGGKTG
jgi:hypothetical protein